MKKFVTLSLIIFSTSLLASSVRPKLTVDVSLSPAGSFQITSERIRGRVYETQDGKIEAKNVKVLVRSLETGITLRDNHLREKLGLVDDEEASVMLLEAYGENAKGTAKLKVKGKIQEVPFIYKKLDERFGEATFSLNLDQFGITGISYMNVGVENKVDVTVVMPVVEK